MNKTWEVTKSLLVLQISIVVGNLLLIWFLEGISYWVFDMLDRPKDLPIVISVGEWTSYMFFLFGLACFPLMYKRYLVHGLNRKTVLHSYIIATLVGVFIHSVIMGGSILLSTIDISNLNLLYYLINLFFDGVIGFLLGSILRFSFYRNKGLAFILFIPVLIGALVQIYIWLGHFDVSYPYIYGPDFNIIVSTLASAIFSFMLYFILKRISNQMPIKI